MGDVISFPGGMHQPLTLVQALAELEQGEREVMRRRWGIGRALQSDDEIAEGLGVDVIEVWTLQDKALQTLGFLWLTETLLPAYVSFDEAA